MKCCDSIARVFLDMSEAKLQEVWDMHVLSWHFTLRQGDHMAGHSYSCIVGEKPSWVRGDGGKEFRIQGSQLWQRFLEHADLLHWVMGDELVTMTWVLRDKKKGDFLKSVAFVYN